MDSKNIVSLKVYLFLNDSHEPEIRRFGIDGNVLTSYYTLSLRILEVFPVLSDKVFTIYWTDEEDDEIIISSDEELNVALKSMTSDVKKFYVKTKSLRKDSNENENSISHPGVYCDGCQGSISGFRYKCVVCNDYDLCKSCEQAGVHDQHPMLKIPHPVCFDRMKLRMLPHVLGPFTAFNVNETLKHHRRRHSHDGGHPDSCKKKKRSEKRESGQETGDESEEGCHKKHSHKKSRRATKCHYSQLMSDFLNYFAPPDFQAKQGCTSTESDFSHLNYMKTVGSTLQKLLDPLGVNVEFEVRGKEEEKKEEKKETEKKEEKKETEKKEKQSSPATKKEVRFEGETPEVMKQKIDEITKILASQSVSQTTSSDNDGWVSFEELKKDSEEPQPSSSGEGVPSAPKEDPKASQPEKRTPETQEKENLYPNLSFQHVPSDPKVRASLEKMLAMGFTNEGNWLTSLLEAKQGDINQVLEVLVPYKKN